MYLIVIDSDCNDEFMNEIVIGTYRSRILRHDDIHLPFLWKEKQ